MKGKIIIPKMKYPPLPPFKLRSEKQMEELLHRARVVARKNQISMLKLEQDIPSFLTSIRKNRKMK